MPSTRTEKAKEMRSSEMDILSGYGNMDIMLGGENSNEIERELETVIIRPKGHSNTEALFHLREHSSQEWN